MTKHANLGQKRCFEQTDAPCWKSLKSGQHSAKMLKRADLGLKTLFWKNLCKSQNDKTSWSRAENAALYKLVHFAEKC